MTTRLFRSLGLSALVLGGATFGCAATGDGIAVAGTRASRGKEATLAGKALARHDPATAIAYAEAAVAMTPGSADYRMLLARSYMQAGRFRSAREAFGDVLRLSPDNGRAALNLALAEIATGDRQAGRRTLDDHADRIAPSDRGLALALAGDPAAAVALLTAAARQPGADAKLRQNLGLALALAGQWPMARAVAAADLSPADVDGRIAQWAQFAQPSAASDQVAALIGARAVEDGGQPTALALATPQAPVATAASVAAPAPVAAPAALARVEAQPAFSPVLSAARIVFAPRHEVVQPLRQAVSASPLLRATPDPIKVAAGAPAGHRGNWVVQLGAFADRRGAENAWNHATRRLAGLGDHQPRSMSIRVGGATLQRLSVAGFDRAGADTLCDRYRAQGGVCFVRREAGDQIARWLRPTATRLAGI